MVSKSLTALIFGSGFAGQGHARALSDAGVEIVGMVSRTRHIVDEVAVKLEIPYADTDWDKALVDLKPDIVAIGTPSGAHFEPIMAALKHECHVFCDKPLAATTIEAKTLYQEAKKVGVKTAYAASYRYMPDAALAKELVAQGVIGEPQEVECISHFNLNPLIPFSWSHRLEQGGGRLHNNFTHKLSLVQHVLGGEVTAVFGHTRSDMERAPVVDGVHHFRERRNFIPKSADDPNLEWKEANSDWSYTVLAQIEAERPAVQPVSALFKHSGLQPRFHSDYITFYGSEGAILIEGHYGHGPLHLYKEGAGWQEVPLPEHIRETQPDIDDHTQRNWNILAREFVADVRGEGNSGYQTFADGWLYQEIVEAVRHSEQWIRPSSWQS